MQKITLKDYASQEGQAKAAAQLGVRQSAISKAIRAGRNVTVFIHDDGRIEAEELKSFPNQKAFGSSCV